jgi:micrococcal nuclease
MMDPMTTRLLATALVLSLTLNVVLVVQHWPSDDGAPQGTTTSTSAEGPAATDGRTAAYESGKQYPFMRVVDGDTIVVGVDGSTEYVRLIGIDTAEMNDPGGPQCYAEQATAHLRDLLSTGTVVLTFDATQGMRDKYGRLLAYVELPNGTDLNETMLRDGYAQEYTYNAPYVRQAAYKAAEADAMDHERGLWAPSACAPQASQTTN